MQLRDLQKRCVEIGTAVFGAKNATDPNERTLRFAEEAFELLRARGVKFITLQQMLVHEYFERSAGEESQELAGAQNTLFALANSLGYDLEALVLADQDALLAKKDAASAKHAAKPDFAKAV
jgi:hypothetical protein